MGAVFRVWVAGCASGEEAYSIAMVLQELLDADTLAHSPVDLGLSDLCHRP
jgi:chemotaxis methyl-accepting protein methylase